MYALLPKAMVTYAKANRLARCEYAFGIATAIAKAHAIRATIRILPHKWLGSIQLVVHAV